MNEQKIKMLVMDVDGTLTDGKIYMGLGGEAMKAFDVKDGYAIAHMLPEMGIVPVVITGRKSAIVACRCEELGIRECHQGAADKLAILRKVAARHDLDLSQVAYIGDDLNDLECMRAIRRAGGFTVCPADAVEAVREISQCVSNRFGGRGAVRDAAELLLVKLGRA